MAKSAQQWDEVRGKFCLAKGKINLANLALASNPLSVFEAITRHRDSLDAEPWEYLKKSLHNEEAEVCAAVSKYFGVDENNIALTTGTTLGLALLYAGIRMKPGQEILTTLHEFKSALDIMDWRTAREGIAVRKLMLIPDPPDLDDQTVLAMLQREIRPHTRVLALTWVYSNTGVKLPIPAIAKWLRDDVNASRKDENKVLLCVDGVHGFGAEGTPFEVMGCDFFVSGCHKWIYGPRGTGIWCGTEFAWTQYDRLVPTSSRMTRIGLRNSPGGVQAYEHVWAMQEAFEFLLHVGPSDIADRVHELAMTLKTELAKVPKLKVITPMRSAYSAGVVCVDVPGVSADDAVTQLLAKDIVATTSSTDAGRPCARHLRLSVAMYTTDDEVKECVDAIRSL
jgi:isopenicillin-N epimerase